MFHYIKEGRSFGPVSADDLRSLLDTGVVSVSDLARAEGHSGWVPARQLIDDLDAGRLANAAASESKHASTAPPGAHTVFTSAPPAALSTQPPRQPVAGNAQKNTTPYRCPACVAPVSPDARFCQDCGQALRRGCARCGGANDVDAAFCQSCGDRL